MPPIIDSTGNPLQLITDYHDPNRLPSQKYLNSENFPELLSDYRNLNGGEIGRIIDRHICAQWQSLTDLAGINMRPYQYLDDDIKDVISVLYGRYLIINPQNDYRKSAEELLESYGHREDNHAKAKVLLFCWNVTELQMSFLRISSTLSSLFPATLRLILRERYSPLAGRI